MSPRQLHEKPADDKEKKSEEETGEYTPVGIWESDPIPEDEFLDRYKERPDHEAVIDRDINPADPVSRARHQLNARLGTVEELDEEGNPTGRKVPVVDDFHDVHDYVEPKREQHPGYASPRY